MAVSAAIGAAVIGASATAYSVHEQKATAEDAARNADRIAADQLKQSQAISLPNTTATSANIQAAQQQAASAGGTIKSQPGLIGDGSGATKKSLLGQ